MRNSRGSALIESLPVAGLLIALIGGIVLAGYLIFAHVWIQFQGEQTLYCLAESGAENECRQKLELHLKQLLPAGTVKADLSSHDDQWKVRIEWKLQEFTFHIERTLSSHIIGKSKAALLW